MYVRHVPFHNRNSSDKVMSYLYLHVLRKFYYIISGNQFIVHIIVISFMEEILSPKNKAVWQCTCKLFIWYGENFPLNS
jgi:hypothetical protein